MSLTPRQTKRDIQKKTIFAPTAYFNLPQTLHARRERRDNSQRCQSPQFCESCGATYKRICEMFSALQRTSVPLTNTEKSFQIGA